MFFLFTVLIFLSLLLFGGQKDNSQPAKPAQELFNSVAGPLFSVGDCIGKKQDHTTEDQEEWDTPVLVMPDYKIEAIGKKRYKLSYIQHNRGTIVDDSRNRFTDFAYLNKNYQKTKCSE